MVLYSKKLAEHHSIIPLGSLKVQGAVFSFTIPSLKPNTEYTIVGYAIMNGKEYRSSGFRTKTLAE